MAPIVLSVCTVLVACGGGSSAAGVDGGAPDARTGSDAAVEAGTMCTAPTVMGGSSGGGNYSTGYEETCGSDASYSVLTTCPYGEVECPSAPRTVPYDCDSGARGAFAACGLPHQ